MALQTIKPVADYLANTAKTLEERLAPDWVLLEGFPRSLQLDSYSCGAQCAFAVLKYYGKARSIRNVTLELGTTEDGTTSTQLKALFARRGLWPVVLRTPTVKALKNEIDRGHPLIVAVDKDHWAAIYGYGNHCVFVADPAINRGGLCRHPMQLFRSRWNRWAMAIRPRYNSRMGRPVYAEQTEITTVSLKEI